jgi:hypothetical protein
VVGPADYKIKLSKPYGSKKAQGNKKTKDHEEAQDNEEKKALTLTLLLE